MEQIKTAPGIRREQLRLPPPSTTRTWTRPDRHPWGQLRCSWNVRGSPPASPPLPCSVWWVLISDTVSEQNWKRVPLQLVRHAGPTLHKGLRTGSLVCGAWESRVPQGLFSSLAEIRSMAQAVNIFVLLTSACQGLQPGEKEVWREGKQKTFSHWCGQESRRIKMSTCSDVSIFWPLQGCCYFLGKTVCIQETFITCYSRLWDGEKETNKEVPASKNPAI